VLTPELLAALAGPADLWYELTIPGYAGTSTMPGSHPEQFARVIGMNDA
jgi:hypothetical protein